MENETDVIRNQMLETRTALTEKLEALQETVVSAVQGTTESVTETVQSVKEAVQDTVSNVRETVDETVETVKSTFDIGKQVESHPWAMFGGAVALGFLGGKLIPSAHTAAHTVGSAANAAGSLASGPYAGTVASHLSSSGAPGTGSSGYQAPQASHAAHASSQGLTSSLFSGLTEALQPMVKDLEKMAIGTLAGMIGQMAVQAAPDQLKPQLKEFVEKVNNQLGGAPVQWSAGADTSAPGSTARPSQPYQHQRL